MKITTGKFKGRNLVMPKGIRPTQGKARKAVFDILGDIEGLSFLELFAGSGAVGIEAASRGAKEVVLVENNPNVLKVLSSNAACLPAAQYCVLPQDAEKALASLSRENKRFDIIFLDPPYYNPKALNPGVKISGYQSPMAAVNKESLAKKTLQTLEAYDILAPNGLIVVQHFKREDLPVELGVLRLFRQYAYGSTILSLFRRVKG